MKERDYIAATTVARTSIARTVLASVVTGNKDMDELIAEACRLVCTVNDWAHKQVQKSKTPTASDEP